MDIKEQANQIVDSLNGLKVIIEKARDNIITPSYNKFTKAQKSKFDKEMSNFIDNLEAPDIKGQFQDFINKTKK